MLMEFVGQPLTLAQTSPPPYMALALHPAPCFRWVGSSSRGMRDKAGTGGMEKEESMHLAPAWTRSYSCVVSRRPGVAPGKRPPSPRLTCEGSRAWAGEAVCPRGHPHKADLSGVHTPILNPAPSTRFCPLPPKMSKVKWP